MKLIAFTLALAGLTLFANPALAGCDPECEKPKICRYEAAGDKFYCAEPATKGKATQGEAIRPSGGRAEPGRVATPSGGQRQGAER